LLTENLPDIFVSSPAKRIESESKKIVENTGEKISKNPWAAFVALPPKIRFENQDKEEKIILLLRRHWSWNFSWIFISLLMIAAPLIVKTVPLISFLPQRFQVVTLIFWYLVVLAFIFENFLSWFFNVYIITDERIIDVDFVSLTYRRISDAQLERIQDITYKTGGLLKAIFDFGDVYIQTAGTAPELEFELVPKPAKVVKILNQLLLQEQQEKLEGRIR
jgi:uncharacterized membrane protein YdbT with pleckstrin-like domain